MTGDKFTLLAQPWWVNLLILAPAVSYLIFQKYPIRISRLYLLATAVFSIAFGYVEAAVVIYIGAAIGLLPGYQNTLAEVRRLAAPLFRQPVYGVPMPPALVAVEVPREAATIVMLAAIALLAGRTRSQRWAAFLWCFALWDISYYAGLWAAIRWPYSLLAPDVLFLIPVPWIAQVWFPLLVSGLSAAAVLLKNKEAPGKVLA